MIRRSRALAATLLAAVLVTASACSSSKDSDDSSSGSGGALTKVSYVTAFGAVGRDSFIWVAKEKGYFKDAGLDVDIQLGAGNVQNLTLLKADKVQFAALDFTGAEIQAGLGAFTDWRAVAAIHQQTLVSIMTTKPGITQPTDLAGKTIATGDKSVSQLLWPAYAKLAHIDTSKITLKGVQATTLNALMKGGTVDALSTFLLSQKTLEKVTGKPAVVLPYSTYLSDLFGNAIIAKPELISSNRDEVQKFTDAAMKGLQYTLDHPDEAAAILNKAQPTALVAGAVGEVNAMKPYVAPAGGAPIGHMDEQRVARSIAVLQANGLMPAGLTPDKVADFSFVPAK